MPTLVQMDFAHDGPWEVTQARRERAESIAREPGFVWKIWTENREEGRAGGIYLFEDEASARAYARMHEKRLAEAGARDMRVRFFSINAELSEIGRAWFLGRAPG